VSFLAALLGLAGGVEAFLPHRGAWVGHNGDHYYYASTALQYVGIGYEESLRIAATYFGYPYSATQLDLGYLNPAVAPLIYPRTVLGLLAVPTVHVWGIDGVWFPGALCGVLSVVLLVVLAVRRVGRIGVLVLPVLVGVTRYAPEFMFGIYAEAPVILATTLMLLAFPLGRARRTWWHAMAAAGLVPIMMLSRQVPLLPTGMVLGGFLWAWIASRQLRNSWLPFVLTILPLTVGSYWLLSVWAPYDVLSFLYEKTGTSTPDELRQALPAMWGENIGADWDKLVATDVPMIVVAGLALVGFLLVLRNPLAGVFLGTLVSGTATELLNGQPNDFRYLAPSLPVVFLLAALVIAGVVHWLPRLLGQTARDWPGASLLQGQPRRSSGVVHVLPDGRMTIRRPVKSVPDSTPWGSVAAAVGVWLATAVVVAGTMVVHPTAPLAGAAQEQVSQIVFGDRWPFRVPEGTLVCSGQDYQMWFVTPDGVRYALSGTAMAASLRTPRVLELAPLQLDYGWPQLRPMLSEGMTLCGSDRGFQAESGSRPPT
jgi:hypothetical protein